MRRQREGGERKRGRNIEISEMLLGILNNFNFFNNAWTENNSNSKILHSHNITDFSENIQNGQIF